MNIAQCILSITPHWHCRMGASDAVWDVIESSTKLVFPPDYKEFMKWSDGGEGKISHVYLSLWPSTKIVKLNQDYKINHYLGDKVLAIGSDGGSICFLLDYRFTEAPTFASVNVGDLDPREIKSIAQTFTSALSLAISGQLVGDEL
ncbi:SMI1/KNR4 family protein [Pectobacterium brasiliense]|uniref:SMI1/KNR4 family protein n=1 Tax=Pectobacterium brasiliense TaxID=180957 RepID=UPI0019695854|nr:SMI1/KNR4 family protein [Pectobacterium brasiliense]